MNCKQGDLAIIVRSAAGNEGAIVRCTELVEDVVHLTFGIGPAWVVDRRIKCATFGTIDMVLDRCLRPIRPDEGEDEMLRIAGKPQETVPA